MLGIGWRLGRAAVVPALASVLLLAAPQHASAGELDDFVRQSQVNIISGQTTKADAPQSTDGATTNAVAKSGGAGSDDSGKLENATDFYPETDQWTERNNRIKISAYFSGLLFGRNLRIEPDFAEGLQLSWEVPGFIGVRLNTVVVPGYSRMQVSPEGGSQNGASPGRHITGTVDCTSLSIAIFNPELSMPSPGALAMWAGLGLDLWIYHYTEDGLTFISNFQHNFSFNTNPGMNIFFDAEFKVTDNFHIGLGLKDHIVYAPQTERGEFYQIGGVTQGTKHHRNATRPLDLSNVFEMSVIFSILF
jgi:hypothetical protein